MFKNKKRIVLFLMVGVIIAIIIMLVVKYINQSSLVYDDGVKFKDEYMKLNNVATEDGKKYPRVSISDENKIKYTSYDEILDMFNNDGDGVIYFGYAKCLYCRSVVSVLVDAALDTEIDNIYYLDVEEKGEKYDELLTILGDNFIDTSNNERKIYSPLVMFVADGNIVSYNKGTLFSQEDPYVLLDASQIEGLKSIYVSGINDVMDAMIG